MDFLRLFPGLIEPPHSAVQAFAFWLLFLLVPSLSLLAVIGVRGVVASRHAALLATFPAMATTTYRRLFDEGKIKVNTLDYVLPLLILFLLNAFLTILLVAGSGLADGLVDARHYMMLCGPRCAEVTTGEGSEAARVAFQQYQTLTLVVLAYAFLGWVCWALVTIFDRATSLQILPTTFKKITIRLALAVLIAVALRHITQSEADAASFSVIVLGFGAGMFPQRAIAYVEGIFNRLVRATERSEEFGLQLIQGIAPPVVFRLEEIGIDDAIDLGHANPFTLFDSTGYAMTEIVDWIGQAQLLTVVQTASFQRLQAAGLRTIFDVVKVLHGAPGLAMPALPDGLPAGGLSLPLIATRSEYLRLEEVYLAVGSRLG